MPDVRAGEHGEKLVHAPQSGFLVVVATSPIPCPRRTERGTASRPAPAAADCRLKALPEVVPVEALGIRFGSGLAASR